MLLLRSAAGAPTRFWIIFIKMIFIKVNIIKIYTIKNHIIVKKCDNMKKSPLGSQTESKGKQIFNYTIL